MYDDLTPDDSLPTKVTELSSLLPYESHHQVPAQGQNPFIYWLSIDNDIKDHIK